MEEIKWGLVVQARAGSTRLPNKMLKPFAGFPSLLEVILRTLKKSFPDSSIVLATTDQVGDNELAAIAENLGLAVFRGSESDVLSRFIGVADAYGFSNIIRVCADNPFIQEKFISELVRTGINHPDADYISFCFHDGLPTIRSHSGFFAEWVSVAALKKTAQIANENIYHEHVTNFIYTHPDKFKVVLIQIPDDYQGFLRSLRLTIDAKSDWEIAENLYIRLSLQEKTQNLEAIKKYIEENPALKEKMQKNIKENEK